MQALYRLYRPQTFSQLVGQEHVSETLLTALKTGQVSQATVTSGPALLHRAAVDSVRRWKYTPASLDGKPVPVDLTVRVDFRLE